VDKRQLILAQELRHLPHHLRHSAVNWTQFAPPAATCATSSQFRLILPQFCSPAAIQQFAPLCRNGANFSREMYLRHSAVKSHCCKTFWTNYLELKCQGRSFDRRFNG
jgi:hypothetical protein